ncbi:MAG: hypothetical protein GTN67_12965 [Hydrotalea flava]|uniref:hypothetical protein n=1 Tax=Hydrotalea TaxID=1004300 RepID=UPI000942B927|nr:MULTISPECIES: hypothetical protein [Hydrotalea]MBY0347889.1 hypothetical protein [Hydrotalea flava]NIM36229.1 hypothetical protein [Hydrotalea flava]NIM39080.1 hypothetical protein [Hydrotalea flava]NIN04315.1 hypothetical protein [Hydrotalea flava]NIN15941.1 hypothetical protein [Hydrotalea flava]
MARVIVDVPSEKVQPFIELILQMGLDKHTIASDLTEIQNDTEATLVPKPLCLFKEKYLLFDWEFFSNELEFE